MNGEHLEPDVAPGVWWARMRSHPYTWAVVALSIVAHLVALGLRPMAHDEAIDARFSWMARAGGVIEYDPIYHGPLRFYLEGFVLNHFGITPGWTRLVAALAGIAATIVIAYSTRLLGRFGAPFAALLFTISPTVLTVTRTGREDSLTGLVSLALLLVIANALIEPKPRHIIGAGALLAVSFTLKETTFIFGLAGFVFFVGLVIQALRRRDRGAGSFFTRLGALGRQPWMWSFVAFVAIFLFVFTSAFRYGKGFKSGLVDGIEYWWSQHDVRRGSQRWFFYATIYVGYEWLVIGAATIGLVVTVRRRATPRSMIGAWFATMAIVQFAVYSWAGEKFAWLALHPLIPAVLLGGLGGQALVERFRNRTDASPARLRLAAAGMVVLAVGTAAIGLRPAITDGADTRELLVTVQTTTSVPEIADRLADARAAGTLGPILIDERDSGSWPWAWYVQGWNDIGYFTIDPTVALPAGYDAYIVSASTDPPPVPPGYTIERFPLRGWWLPDYDNVTIGDIARWFVTRETWNERGTSDQYLIIRESADAAAQPAAAATG
ncbi:MAG: flippase activity-associated protein Agl23 [Ilumatobacteraceae bacterium]